MNDRYIIKDKNKTTNLDTQVLPLCSHFIIFIKLLVDSHLIYPIKTRYKLALYRKKQFCIEWFDSLKDKIKNRRILFHSIINLKLLKQCLALGKCSMNIFCMSKTCILICKCNQLTICTKDTKFFLNKLHFRSVKQASNRSTVIQPAASSTPLEYKQFKKELIELTHFWTPYLVEWWSHQTEWHCSFHIGHMPFLYAPQTVWGKFLISHPRPEKNQRLFSLEYNLPISQWKLVQSFEAMLNFNKNRIKAILKWW